MSGGRRHLGSAAEALTAACCVTEQSFSQSVVDFQNAIRLDPDYAAAYAGLADAYTYEAIAEQQAPVELMPLMAKNATLALEKDPSIEEAYISLGIMSLAYDWDWPVAEQRFRKSLALNSHDAFTQHFLAHYYEFMGRWPEALKQMQLALDMEKLSPMYGEDVVYDLFVNRRYEEAARNIGQIVAQNPHDVYAQNLRALALEAIGKREESLAAADRAWSLPGNFSSAASLSGVYCRQGRVAKARQILKELQDAQAQGRYVASYELAGVNFALGQRDAG